MATEEIEISELELAEELAPDNLIPIESLTDTKATTLQKIKEWLSSFFVGKTGDETISGTKTFTSRQIIQSFASDGVGNGFKIKDSNNKGYVGLYEYVTSDGSHYARLLNNSYGKNAYIDIQTNLAGLSTINLSNADVIKTKTPSEISNDTHIATTAWVNTVLANKKVMTAPDFSNKVEITSGYVAPSNGYVVAHNRSGDINLRLYVEGLELGGAQTAHGGACAAFAVVAKGNTITYTGNNVVAYFIPCF